MDSFKNILFVATCISFILLAVNGNVTQPPFTPRDIPDDACGSLQAMRDACFDFTDYVKGNVRATDPRYYIACNNGIPVCTDCPAGLFFSNKCQRCEFNEDDSLNSCPTIQQSEPATTFNPPMEKPDCDTAADRTFCNTRSDGNFANPNLPYCYYACYTGSTTPMSCPNMLLIFDQSCNACVTELHNSVSK